MELITLVLASLMGVVSAGGLVLDEVAESSLRQSLVEAESLSVRIDNTPSYQIANGAIDRVRIAGRGLFPLEDVRVAAVDIETDAIALDLADLQSGTLTLEEPLIAAARLELTQADLDRALQSPYVVEQLQNLTQAIAGDETLTSLDTFINPRLDLLADNRLRIEVLLENDDDPVAIAAEFKLERRSASALAVTDLRLTIDDQPMPDNLLNAATELLEQQLDLRQWEDAGIVARYLHVAITDDTLVLAGIVQVNPEAFHSD